MRYIGHGTIDSGRGRKWSVSKVTCLPGSSQAIEIQRTEDFKATAEKLSNFIKMLPLSQVDNDKLIALIVTQIQQAEKDAFEQGLTLGIKMGRGLNGSIEGY
jgi:hypothetical protein